jgi:predicted metalloprotease with PDZ domain
MADVRIREQSNETKSLYDALHAILAAGGDGRADWPLQRVLDVGDQATGAHVLNELHDQYGPKPAVPDLGALWKELGVIPHNGVATFDERAPLANVRRAITELKKNPRKAGG